MDAPISLWQRFVWELSLPLFSIEEPNPHGSLLHLDQCFVPHNNRCVTFLLRASILALALQVLYHDVTTYPPHNLYIYMGYLTHWGFVLTIFYLTVALCCCCFPIQEEPLLDNTTTNKNNNKNDDNDNNNTVVTIASRKIHRWAWVLYSIAAPLEVCICLLYWCALADATFTYVSIMEHGVFAILLLVDGNLIGAIPMRIRHLLFLEMVCVLYFVWSMMDAYFGIGNGEWGPAYEDDALYPVLNWNAQSETAAIVSAFSVLVLAPVVYMLCWCLSLVARCGKCCVLDGSRRPIYRLATKDENDCHYYRNGQMV